MAQALTAQNAARGDRAQSRIGAPFHQRQAMLLTHGVRFLATVALSPVMMSTDSVVSKFPTSATPPLDVAMAQLDALRDADIEKVYSLF